MAATVAAIAAATFCTLLQPVADGVPPPFPIAQIQGLQHHCVGLCLFASPQGHPVLLPPAVAAAGEAISSHGDKGESEPEVSLGEIQAGRGGSALPRVSSPSHGGAPGVLADLRFFFLFLILICSLWSIFASGDASGEIGCQ
jgi:hypothetical protein